MGGAEGEEEEGGNYVNTVCIYEILKEVCKY